jgi:hypothetical protein
LSGNWFGVVIEEIFDVFEGVLGELGDIFSSCLVLMVIVGFILD